MKKLVNQSEKFNLDSKITYLNGAFMSPQLKLVSEVGMKALKIKESPSNVQVNDFFDTPRRLRQEFSKMVNNPDPKSVALIPSVSYGMAVVARNINTRGKKIIIAGEQFPSNVYPWMRLVSDQGGELEIIEPPKTLENRGETWNNKILEAIDNRTSLVAIGHVHWADGTLFDLLEIRRRTNDVGSLLVIDGTQSVGALPFDVERIKPDALVCAGYKWLLGPYGLGVGFFGEAFTDGVPIEENWINRLNSEDFAGLVDFEEEYQPGALRYGMGEQSNFILAPMLLTALEQINEWNPENIQTYCTELIEEPLARLSENGFWLESGDYRASHLFGIRHESVSIDKIKQRLTEAGVFVSYRGTSIRVSPYVHNSAEQINQLVDTLIKAT